MFDKKETFGTFVVNVWLKETKTDIESVEGRVAAEREALKFDAELKLDNDKVFEIKHKDGSTQEIRMRRTWFNDVITHDFGRNSHICDGLSVSSIRTYPSGRKEEILGNFDKGQPSVPFNFKKVVKLPDEEAKVTINFDPVRQNFTCHSRRHAIEVFEREVAKPLVSSLLNKVEGAQELLDLEAAKVR